MNSQREPDSPPSMRRMLDPAPLKCQVIIVMAATTPASERSNHRTIAISCHRWRQAKTWAQDRVSPKQNPSGGRRILSIAAPESECRRVKAPMGCADRISTHLAGGRKKNGKNRRRTNLALSANKRFPESRKDGFSSLRWLAIRPYCSFPWFL